MRGWWIGAWVAACTPAEGPVPVRPEVGDPTAWSQLGPGLGWPSVSEADVFQPCTSLTGGEQDVEHHNLVVPWQGYFLLPWAPENGGGGLTFFDLSDPCQPVKVGEAYDFRMRESHNISFGRANGKQYAAVDYHEELEDGSVVGGIGFWDITDVTAPVWAGQIALPGYAYPDAYIRVTLSTFWVGDVLYAPGGVNGVYVLDVSDPEAPSLLSQFVPAQPFVTGTFHVVGDVALLSAAGLSRTVMVDVSDPVEPREITLFDLTDAEGQLRSYYFANVGGRYGLFARNNTGGGPVVYDLSNPFEPVRVGDAEQADADGGYVFRHNDALLQGESNYGAAYDFADPSAPVPMGRFELAGDLDTVTPLGHLAAVAVDERAESGRSTVLMPWRVEPDLQAPSAEWMRPGDGATGVAPSTAVGVSFDEMVWPESVTPASFRLWTADWQPVSGRLYVQENLVNFVADAPLAEDTTYVLELADGGVSDVSGNRVEGWRQWRFSTGDRVRSW